MAGGFGLGGSSFVQARQGGERLNLESRRLDIVERGQESTRRSKQISDLRTGIDDLLDDIGEKIGKGAPVEAFIPIFKAIRSQSMVAQETTGEDLLTMTDAKIQNVMATPTPVQAASIGASADVAGARASAQAAGISDRQALQAAKIIPSSAIANIDPSKYTTASLQVFSQTGDFTRLVERSDLPQTERALTRIETAALAEGVDQARARTGKLTAVEAQKVLQRLASTSRAGDTVNTVLELAALSVGGHEMLNKMRAGQIDEEKADEILRKARENLGFLGMIFNQSNFNPSDPQQVSDKIKEIEAKSQ